MSTLLQTGSPTQTARFESLLRATKAISSARDCDYCEEVFARELRSVIPFDYLHVSMFECDHGDSGKLGWRLFDVNGTKRQFPEAELPLNDIELTAARVHETGQPLVIGDWNNETRFPSLPSCEASGDSESLKSAAGSRTRIVQRKSLFSRSPLTRWRWRLMLP
ncbi:MAG: hypothetical protein DMG73_10645 [Acidobacteria bacterium]|nr:MAG: hypothetical protein DMG73_10645 [Acidobacteriota bacterium]